MGRKEVFHSEDVLQCLFEAVKGRGTGITIICLRHGCQLVVRHGIDPAIGEHVEKNVGVSQEKCIVTRLFDAFQALIDGKEVEFLNDPNTVHFNRSRRAGEKFNVCHKMVK
jgi:hypothetical protein